MNRFINMFSPRDPPHQHTYPDVPGSLRSDSVELSGFDKIQDARATSASNLTPYLGLRSRLSQIWINRWTILLLLVLVRVLLLIASLNDNVGSAKEKALSACTKVEDVGSSMASMPHYLSLGVNEMAAMGVETAVKAMVSVLEMILTGVESMIFFFINFLVGTYVCLLTALIKGSLDAVASVTEDIGKVVNKLIDSATDDIESISSDIEDGINNILDGVTDFFSPGSNDKPEVDFSKPIAELKNFDLDPNDFAKDIRKVNEHIPNFDEVKNITQETIAIPFDYVRKALNDSYGDYKFNRDVFPLAQKEKMTFCSDNNTLNDFFQSLYDLIAKSRIIFIVVLVLLAVAVIAPMAWYEIKRWRRTQRHARLVEKNSFDPMDVVYIASRPTTSSFGVKLGSRFSGKRQVLVRWCIAYATSPSAIFVLSLALAGLFSCLCQFILLRAVQSQVPALTKQVGEFAGDVVGSLNHVSEEWATDANGVMQGLEDDINDDVLAYVTNATDAVNDTLTVFMDKINDGIETVFDDTILVDPIKTVVRCIIGLKVESVQKGLTWVHDKAHVALPMFANDTFSLGAAESIDGDSDMSTFLAAPGDATEDEVSGAVQKVVDWLRNGIVVEALISTGILLVYVIVVLLGVIRALAGMAMPDKTRAEGGGNGFRFTGDDRPPLTPRSQPQAWTGESDQFQPHGSETHIEGGYYGSGDEKGTGAVGARPRHNAGHVRNSSYGEIDHASNKF
ncbi:uncharacterized protein F5Z01DRAFT_405316 [Emericellopsis atlantica]|uniref:Plasma membrane fusion protein PRM1 n=1 Tax=Emericellopsis atlantica TaxID=2614577 RepID=A0A9P8CSX7_9HYPO|nr:uncharacterized protein F5Z01DRAFT_405316 [Emericellopsis atlantica]KAG9257640.1 hypothetical protein F5Z01DRAFT_405316 [Emericellopsis atlantica]